MSISKEKSYTLKDRAKELGYDIKLTHCQELIAKLEGFSNRHALLLNDKDKPLKELEVNTEYLTNKIKSFIIDNEISKHHDIVKTLLSPEHLELLKKNIETAINNTLSPSLPKLRFFEFTDDCNQIDCIAAYNQKQAIDYMIDVYGDDYFDNRYTMIEVSEEKIKNLKMHANESGKGKKTTAYKILEQELKDGSSIPLTLYCNWF